MNGSHPVAGALAITALAAYLSYVLMEQNVQPEWARYVFCVVLFSLGGAFYNVDRISAWFDRPIEGEESGDKDEQG